MASRYIPIPVEDPEYSAPAVRVPAELVSPSPAAAAEPLPAYAAVKANLPSYDDITKGSAQGFAGAMPPVVVVERASGPLVLSEEIVGNWVHFLFTALMSVVFSWIGFLVCCCLSTSIAGRYGALAGFGIFLMLMANYQHRQAEIHSDDTQWLEEHRPATQHWFMVLTFVVGIVFLVRGLHVFTAARCALRRALVSQA